MPGLECKVFLSLILYTPVSSPSRVYLKQRVYNYAYFEDVYSHGGVYVPYIFACEVTVAVDDSGLCCVCATSFERLLTPLFVGSTQAPLSLILCQTRRK